jgi:hypothetical protein
MRCPTFEGNVDQRAWQGAKPRCIPGPEGWAFEHKDTMTSSDGRQRRFRITIRVSLPQRQFIDEAARRSGITRSAQ